MRQPVVQRCLIWSQTVTQVRSELPPSLSLSHRLVEVDPNMRLAGRALCGDIPAARLRKVHGGGEGPRQPLGRG